jgi:hypothetical protein
MAKFKTIVYIDGFNFYYGIKRMYHSEKTPYDSCKWRESLWLDLVKFSESLLLDSQELVMVKYFTARVGAYQKEKSKRQNAYLDVLKTLGRIRIIEGEFKLYEETCQVCDAVYKSPKEKQTDVNLATELLTDAIDNNFEIAVLITSDSDYKSPVQYIKKKYPNKRLDVQFLESNYCYELAKLAYRTFIINRDQLISHQLPEVVTLKNGYQVYRPETWK